MPPHRRQQAFISAGRVLLRTSALIGPPKALKSWSGVRVVDGEHARCNVSRRALEYTFLILSSMSNIHAILFSPEMTLLSQLNSFNVTPAT